MQVIQPKLKPGSDHIELCLLCLEDSPVECDGMSYLISAALRLAGWEHSLWSGYLEDTHTGFTVIPHVWIEIECRHGRSIIDFRLRMWLGDKDYIPHGVFKQNEHSRFRYHGLPLKGPDLNLEILDSMSDGRFSHVSIPALRDAAL